MLSPLLEKYEATDHFMWIDPEAITTELRVYKDGRSHNMQIKEFENIIETNNLRGLILDPISVIVDFNSELQVYNFVYPMRQIAKKRKCCIVFFRNEGN